MVRFDGIAAILALSAAGTSAFAADLSVKTPPYLVPNDILQANNQISADFIDTNFNYREFNDPARSGGAPGVVDSEKGWVPGGQISYSLMKDWFGLHNLYTSGSFSWSRGQTDYWSQPLQQKDDADVKDWDFRLGKGFDLAPNAMLTPYFGAGTHSWTRTLPGPSGFSEHYTHSYAGGGLLLQYAPFSRVVFSAYGLVGGTFGSHLSGDPTPGGFPLTSFAMTLGNSTIYMAGGSFDYAITQQWHANVGVDYVNFKYGESGITSAGPLLPPIYEPNSHTSNTTLKIGLGYSFY